MPTVEQRNSASVQEFPHPLETEEDYTSPLTEDAILPSMEDLPFLAPEVVLPTAEELFVHRFELLSLSEAEDSDEPPDYDELFDAFSEHRRRITGPLLPPAQNEASSSLPATASAPSAGSTSPQTRSYDPDRKMAGVVSMATIEDRARRPETERVNTFAPRSGIGVQDALPISPTTHLPGSRTQLQDTPSTPATGKEARNLAIDRRDTFAARRATELQNAPSILPTSHDPACDTQSSDAISTTTPGKHEQTAEKSCEGSPKELGRPRSQRIMAIEAITTPAEAQSSSPLPTSSLGKHQRAAEESCEEPSERPQRRRTPTWKGMESQATPTRPSNVMSISNLLASTSLTDETTTPTRPSIMAIDTVLTATPPTVAQALEASQSCACEPKTMQKTDLSNARKPTGVSKATSSSIRKRAAPRAGPSKTRKPKATSKVDIGVTQNRPGSSTMGRENLSAAVDVMSLPTGIKSTGGASSKGKERLVDAAEQVHESSSLVFTHENPLAF